MTAGGLQQDPYGKKLAPKMTKMSNYANSVSYTILGKRKQRDYSENIPAANKYDVRQLVDKTSRFRSISQPCSFTRANRFPDSVYSSVTKGPGQYDTAISTLKKDSVSFAKSLRPPIETQIGVGADGPGPGLYEVRGINRKGDPTLDPRTCKQGGRHGWYYENREAGRKPGPGQYTLNFEQVELPVAPGGKCIAGTSLRPSIESHLGVNVRAPSVGPGQYSTKGTLGGPKFSFTTASTRTKELKQAPTCPDFCAQWTQWDPKFY